MHRSLTLAPSLVTLAPRSLPPEGKGIFLNTETRRHKVFYDDDDYDYDNDYDIDKGLSAALLLFKRCL